MAGVVVVAVCSGSIFSRPSLVSALAVINSQPSQLSSPASPGIPVRIQIPTIHVDAAIELVGITPDGAVDVPKGPAEAAWFDLGPRPGEKGSSILVGHYGWKDGIPAVFDSLGRLVKGDKIYIADGTGATTTFVVREIKTFGENETPSGIFSSTDGKAHLNLITCGGIWNKSKKSYSNRLVAFADEVL